MAITFNLSLKHNGISYDEYLTPAYSNDVENYTLTAGDIINDLEVEVSNISGLVGYTCKMTYNGSTTEGLVQTINLIEGTNNLTITVSDLDEPLMTFKTVVISITKDGTIDPPEPPGPTDSGHLMVTGFSVDGISITPGFTSKTTKYECVTYNLDTITIRSSVQNWIGETVSCIMRNSATGEQKEGLVNEFTINEGDNIITCAYRNSKGKTFTITLNVKKKLGSPYWPIQSGLLPPDFYGGTYIPNWRSLRRMSIIGSGDKDYENVYDTLSKDNEDSVKYLQLIINNLTKLGKLNSLVECFIHYSGFVNANWKDDGDFRYYLPILQVNFTRPDHMRNGYKPKNNKLFSYPYSALKIVGFGAESMLKYELLPEKIKFGILSKFQPGATIMMYPISYANVLDNFDAGVTSQPLPLFSYTMNQALNDYNAGMYSRIGAVQTIEEQKQVAGLNAVISGISGFLGGGVDTAAMTAPVQSSDGKAASSGITYGQAGAIALKGVVNAVNSGVQYSNQLLSLNQGLRDMQNSLKDVVNKPDVIGNQNAAPSIPQLVKNAACPYVQTISIRQVFAEKVDEYFTKYGYKVGRVGVPDIYTRPNFNFLMLKDVFIKGSIPQDFLNKIEAILAHGITFWHTTDVGNYNVENEAPIKDNPRYSANMEV